MSTNNPIPEKIRNYNVYSGPTASEKLLGISPEMKLPEFSYETEEISGAGMLGSYESPNVGHTGSSELVVPFRLLDLSAMKLAVGDMANLTLRAGTQSTDMGSGTVLEKGLVINVRGPVKGINIGSLQPGSPMNVEITVEILYFKAQADNAGSMFTLLELDKLNFVYVVNGKDKMAELRRYI